jgi:hypothetical protein
VAEGNSSLGCMNPRENFAVPRRHSSKKPWRGGIAGAFNASIVSEVSPNSRVYPERGAFSSSKVDA